MTKIQELIEKRETLQKQAEELQIKNAEHQFELDLEDRKIIKSVLDHLDKGYTWKTQNAAIVVTLHDRLKDQFKTLSSSEEGTAIVRLRGHELNGLYQVLLTVEGTGVENARRFIKMLTMVGETVSNAMKLLGEMNSKIQEMHLELSGLDKEIDSLAISEEVEPVLETETNN